MKDFDKAFEQAIQMLVLERRPTPRSEWDVKRIFDTTGAIGSGGRFKAGIETIGPKSRAIKEPRSLMKDLGVSGASGGNDLERAYSVLKQAINKNDVLSEAYDPPRIIKVDTGAGTRDCVQVPISSKDLDYRNSVSFVQAILVGAFKAGIMDIDGKIQFVYAASMSGPTFYAIEISDAKPKPKEKTEPEKEKK
jgi:hypothetical protein